MSTNNFDVYEIVTNQIIALLEQGSIPWRKPWADAGMPMNVVSKRPYRGINVWLLASLNYDQNLFITWDQLKKINGSVKQGEHGHVVIFWKTQEKNANLKDEEENKEKRKSILRYYKVFNVAQCTGIPEDLIPAVEHRESDIIVECESVIRDMPNAPAIRYKQRKAFYAVQEDYINMPKVKLFDSDETYYATLFHELVHSTGHEKRLSRKTITDMHEVGGPEYSLEELIAELGACYLCHHTGILNADIKNHVAYIDSWLKQLKNDKRMVVFAASYAQKAVDYILNVKDEEVPKTEEVEQAEVLV